MATLHHTFRGARGSSRSGVPSRVRDLLARRPLATFFLLGFLLSWLLWAAPAFGLRGPAGSLLLVAGIFGPAAAAATVTRLTGGSLRGWFRALVRFRAPPRWYAAIATFPIVVVAATNAVFAATGGTIMTSLVGERLVSYLPLVLIWTLAAVGEEPGWRGFALPRLLERTTPVRATVLLGLVWALWHLPLLAAADEPSHGLAPLPLVGVTLMTVLAIVGYAFFYTYLWNRTRNIWLAILLHGSLSGAIGAFVLLPVEEQVGGTYAHLQALTVVVVALAVALLVFATRGRLGRHEAERRRHARTAPAAIAVIVLLVLAAGVAGAAAAAEPRSQATTIDHVDSFVQGQMDARRVPGVALAVVRDGELVHARGFGSADGGGRPVTPETPFVLGSVTKSFTALAVMQLVDAGEVGLDAPIADYVPELRLADGAVRRVTVRHLLNQTSGIPGLAGGGLLRSVGDGTLLDAVRELEGTTLSAPPGTRFEYANANWVLLGLVIERASGLAYGDYVRQRIFEPLGMRNSFADPDEARRAGLAAGHRYWFGLRVAHGPTSPDAVRPAGYLMSSASDMARYLAMLQNGGELDGRRVISRDGLVTLLEPQATSHLGPWAAGAETRYAMGWFVGGPWEEQALLHPGRDPDSAAMIVLLRRLGLGVVTLANANHELPLPGASGELNRIPRGVVDLLLGNEPGPLTSLARFYVVFDAAVALLVLGIAWTSLRLLRRRKAPVTPRRRAGGLGRGAAEAATGLLLLAVPAVSGQGYAGALLWWPDLAVVLLGAGAALLALGVTRAVLRLRAPTADAAAPRPPIQRTPPRRRAAGDRRAPARTLARR